MKDINIKRRNKKIVNTNYIWQTKRHLFIITLTLFILLLNIITTSALWMKDANFGDVQRGKTYNLTIPIRSSPEEPDNHFVIEKGGDIARWLSFYPEQFDLHAGTLMNITLTLTVPPTDAEFGEYTGYIKALGKNLSAGYSISAISYVRANVRRKTLPNITITNFTVSKSEVERGEVVKFLLSIKNTGNCFANSTANISIYKSKDKEHEIITSIERDIDLAPSEEKLLEVYWNTGNMSGGRYTAVAFSSTNDEIKSSPVQVEVISEESPPLLLAALIIVVIIPIIVVFLLFQITRRF